MYPKDPNHPSTFSRRDALRLGAAGALAAMLPGFAAPRGLAADAAAAPADRRPNVLLIVCDQLGFDAMSRAGCRDVSTPNLDRLQSRSRGGKCATGGKCASHPLGTHLRPCPHLRPSSFSARPAVVHKAYSAAYTETSHPTDWIGRHVDVGMEASAGAWISIHEVARIPSEIRFAAVLRFVQKRGWVLLRVRGSHRVFQRPDGSA